MSVFNRARNPLELPNDRCCPPTDSGEGGRPYSSTRKGCCGTNLFDIYKQLCCSKSGTVLSLDQELDRPFGFSAVIKSFSKNNIENSKTKSSRLAEMTVSWSEVQNADTYELECGSAISMDGEWVQPNSESRILGTGDTMGLSVSVLQNMLVGYKYIIKVRAVDCVGRDGAWSSQTVKIVEDGVELL